ncbi:hypothetical protein DFH27DRAFT_606438 [Peziza echinospora]|nr:hypothetical protein DFH27DRAFT_606438 [Peziza echinospora]
MSGLSSDPDLSNHPYSPSIASSASSSASSIFSVAASVASIATSTGESDRNAWSRDQSGKDARIAHPSRTLRAPPLPVEQRQHHRRRPVCGTAAQVCPIPPVPTLVRQEERKTTFVDSLVDSAAQIVETIWPTYMSGKCESTSGKGVLPLRTFIQETLRRSRTSYSTLQVALYYLIVIRPHIPKGDYSDMSLENAQQMRALQCGRRMFLAALILASKYLQDRNYSARAWSRISGLQTTEININEMAFLEAVNWRLHISESNFQKWTELVVNYTSGPGASGDAKKAEWSKLVLTLTPELTVEAYLPCTGDDEAVDVVVIEGTRGTEPACLLSADMGSGPQATHSTPPPVVSNVSTPISIEPPISKVSVSSLLSPATVPSISLPTLEPQVQQAASVKPYTPAQIPTLPGISPLKTPAVRFGSASAMVAAAAAAQVCLLQRCTTEDMAFFTRKSCVPGALGERSMSVASNMRSTILSRRTSMSCSMTSSPETINDSDSSTSSSPFAFSRSSSISSASSFESVGSFDNAKICPRSSATRQNHTEIPRIPSESGLSTPTPSPPRYLTLRPKASRSFTEPNKSLAHSSRKRRVSELANSVAIEKDLGVSPNFSSGMTPQMNVQLQMRTPPKDDLGSKRLRCGPFEDTTNCIPNYRGGEEVS